MKGKTISVWKVVVEDEPKTTIDLSRLVYLSPSHFLSHFVRLRKAIITRSGKGVLMTKKYSFSWSNNLSQLFWRPIGRLWLTYSSSSFPQRQFLLWRTEGKVISRFFVSHFMTQCLALKWTIQIHFNFNLWINFLKLRHSRSRFLFFLSFQHSWKYICILLMTGFEPWTSGFGSNRSTNCATTTDCPST